MRSLYIFRIAVFILIVNVLIGCGWGEDPYGPKASIYKTKGEYFNFVNTWGTTNGPTSLNADDVRIRIEGDDTIYVERLQLINGYVLASESSPNDYFTDITYGELVEYNDSDYIFSTDSMFERVIDEDPYLEFYVAKDHEFDITRIPEDDSLIVEQLNDIIRKGNLEEYFERLK